MQRAVERATTPNNGMQLTRPVRVAASQLIPTDILEMVGREDYSI